MKQTIEIEVPEGKKAVWKDNKVVFEDITPKMPKTWEEFCKTVPISQFLAHYIESNSEIKPYLYQRLCSCTPIYRKVNEDKNLLPSEEAAEAHLALMQLHQLRDYYRQGWIPKKGELTFNIIKLRGEEYKIEDYTSWNTFLSFKTNKLAQEFFENFEDLIKKAGDLI